MRYIKHHLENIAGVEIYPIISLLIFFLFFVGLTWYVVRMKKSHVERMSQQPLDDNVPVEPRHNIHEKLAGK